MAKLLKDLLGGLDLRNYQPPAKGPKVTLVDLLRNVQENTAMFCGDREKREITRLTADHLLKLAQDRSLTPAFLAQQRVLVHKRNEDVQDKLIQLSVQSKRTLKHAEAQSTERKREADQQFRGICGKLAAASFIQNSVQPFAVFLAGTEHQLNFSEEPPQLLPGSPRPLFSGKCISDFVGFMLTKDIGRLVTVGDDPTGLGKVLRTYLAKMYERIKGDQGVATFLGPDVSQDLDGVYQEVESHITSGLYPKAFAGTPSKEDLKFSQLLSSLSWLTPVQLGVKEKALKYGFWRTGVNALKRLETCTTPIRMLAALLELHKIIEEGIYKFTECREAVGADDLVPALHYVILTAAPKKMRSCLNFINNFRQPVSTMDDMAYVLTTISGLVDYFYKLDPQRLGMTQAEFDARVSEHLQRAK